MAKWLSLWSQTKELVLPANVSVRSLSIFLNSFKPKLLLGTLLAQSPFGMGCCECQVLGPSLGTSPVRARKA